MTILKKKARKESLQIWRLWVLFFFHGKYPLYEPYYLDFFCHQVAKISPKEKEEKG
jgi:hypothetical protein